MANNNVQAQEIESLNMKEAFFMKYKKAIMIAVVALIVIIAGVSDSHSVTGGVYKTRERIHRDVLIRDY